MNSVGARSRVAVTDALFAVVTVALIVIAAVGYGLYASKTGTTTTSTLTSTTTETTTVSTSASAGGVSSELLVAIRNSGGGTLPAPTVTVVPSEPGTTVATEGKILAGIPAGAVATYGYVVTGVLVGSNTIGITIKTVSGSTYNPDVMVESDTPGAVVTPAGGNPTSVSPGQLATYHFTISGGGAGAVTISMSLDPVSSPSVTISV